MFWGTLLEHESFISPFIDILLIVTSQESWMHFFLSFLLFLHMTNHILFSLSWGTLWHSKSAIWTSSTLSFPFAVYTTAFDACWMASQLASVSSNSHLWILAFSLYFYRQCHSLPHHLCLLFDLTYILGSYFECGGSCFLHCIIVYSSLLQWLSLFFIRVLL